MGKLRVRMAFRRLYTSTYNTIKIQFDGMASVHFQRYPRETCTIYNISVDSNRRLEGIGKQLLHDVETYLNHNHPECKRIQLRSNTSAMDFYRCIGFTEHPNQFFVRDIKQTTRYAR